MNQEEIIAKLGEIRQWQQDHEKHDDDRFTAIEMTLANIPKRDEMDDLIRGAMADAIFSAGRGAKMTLLTIATVIGAIAIIGGAGKWILGWIGFEYMIK